MPNSPSKPVREEAADDWFATAFDDLYPVVYQHRTVEAAAPEAAFSIGQLQLCETDRVLDLACGAGRHMHYLLDVTPDVTGLDYSTALLQRAQFQLAGRGNLVRGDMRRLPFHECFDALATYFTTFGYFLDEEENLQTARSAARVLKPGGRFFIDYLNPEHVRANFQPSSERMVEHYCVKETRWIDEAAQRVNKTTTVLRDDEVVTVSRESVRLYDLDAFTALLEQAGLETTAVYGDHEGRSVHRDRPRMIFAGQRKA